MIDESNRRLTAGFDAAAGCRLTMPQAVAIAVAPPSHIQLGAAIYIPMHTLSWR